MSMLRAMRNAKAAGMSAEEIWKSNVHGRRAAAREQGWRPSELAATLEGDFRLLVRVWGKKATEGLDINAS